MPEKGEKKPSLAQRAVALTYGGGPTAPKVVAAGKGLVAARIIETAKANGVAVRSDPALAEALSKLHLDLEIPEDLYVAVAEALAWAYSLDIKAMRAKR